VTDTLTPPTDGCVIWISGVAIREDNHRWHHSNAREADICTRCWAVVPWGPT